MAYRRLNDVENNFTAQFQAVDVDFKVLNGSERLNIFSDILRGNPYLNLDYRDLIEVVLVPSHLLHLVQFGSNLK